MRSLFDTWPQFARTDQMMQSMSPSDPSTTCLARWWARRRLHRLPLSIPVGEGARVRRRYLAQHVVHGCSCGPTWIIPSNRNTPPCVTNTTNPSDIWANHSYGCTVDRAEPEEFVINTVTFLKLEI
ncbi:hypothetical protein [Rhodoferax sp.]|uniref:hypothetical protein n=1 Tax=Rhodoferax sp. TaxID=50421 RepID=UPI002847943E|nr:hypothetical protein [Rhodoferax sp.]MDR3368950.1 hypothetical protein [Rhodoferax sp.]